ncbi:MAG: hypothetical protein UZ04_CHB001001483 [Chlorobi bacterium OLB4]|jgi:hypothetical protein|nr:MAG: hypothetical protein UZ04_CHB001001483 [Chlorobi bacterium OLB4]MBV6399559.1 hypothetical protein [Ignavibacteria bacterium]RIK47816.1 MAG: hypothetical protein DCC60_09590 [Ignavibacteriota bacterium]
MKNSKRYWFVVAKYRSQKSMGECNFGMFTEGMLTLGDAVDIASKMVCSSSHNIVITNFVEFKNAEDYFAFFGASKTSGKDKEAGE